MAMSTFEQEVEVEGHIIDSLILTKILDKVLDLEGDFEIVEFRVGKRKTDHSYARLMIRGKSETHLREILHELHRLGTITPKVRPAKYVPAPANSVLPDDFYSTTNNETFVYLNDRWVRVMNQMMDKAVVVNLQESSVSCKTIRDVKKGDLIVVGGDGIMVRPAERPRMRSEVFEFMSSSASTEKPLQPIVRRVAKEIHETKRSGGRIVVVAGPAVIHAGAAEALATMVRGGYVNALLSGNALAVHDVEYALHGTSLGVNVTEGTPAVGGHRNHMAAINTVFKAGSLVKAVEMGIITSGIIYECVKNGIPFVLAGSIRDDGPLPDIVVDVVEAQRLYREELREADMVLMLASMLHSIAVGNMLPSDVKIVCVDINPLAVTKLLDRGTTQAIGIISDVGAFLPLVVAELDKLNIAQIDLVRP